MFMYIYCIYIYICESGVYIIYTYIVSTYMPNNAEFDAASLEVRGTTER